MSSLKERQKQEAIKRMQMLKLMGEVINDFKKENKLYYSERQNQIFNAVLYWVDNHEEWSNMIKEFEKKWGFMVYHCQLTHTYDGDIISLLYITKDEDEWEQDRQDIKDGVVYAKCVNLDDDFCSDYGYIGIKPSMGGIVRIS